MVDMTYTYLWLWNFVHIGILAFILAYLGHIRPRPKELELPIKLIAGYLVGTQFIFASILMYVYWIKGKF